MTEQKRAKLNKMATALGILIPVMVVLVIVTYLAWSRVKNEPDTVTRVVPGTWVQHSLNADFLVNLQRSTLYPSGSAIGPSQKKFVMRLIDYVDMTMVDKIGSGGPALSTVDYWITLRVKAEELWSKEYPLVAKTRLAQGQDTIAARFFVPFNRVFEDLINIQKETSLGAPNGKYDADVILRVVTTVAGETQPYDSTLAISFGITTSGYVLEAPKELTVTDRKGTDVRVDFPNQIPFFGRTLLAATAKSYGTRMFGGSIAVLLLCVLGYLFLRRQTMDPNAMPYGSLVVSVAEVSNAESLIMVKVSSVKDLIRIAEEAQVPVMQFDNVAETGMVGSVELTGCRCFALVSHTFYYVR